VLLTVQFQTAAYSYLVHHIVRLRIVVSSLRLKRGGHGLRIRTGSIANLLGIASGTPEQTKIQPNQRPSHSSRTRDTGADYTLRSIV
jgi:hypothetical protein